MNLILNTIMTTMMNTITTATSLKIPTIPTISSTISQTISQTIPPNIIVMIVDDVGWVDVGWNNPSIDTPNLNSLAHQGVLLNNFYVHPTCTASRGAYLTSRYSHELNLTIPYTPRTPNGLEYEGLSLADQMKELGYDTYHVGKWHIGHSKRSYLPGNFGYQHYFGNMNGAMDHYRHSVFNSIDLWEDGSVVTEGHQNIHSSELYVNKAIEYISISESNEIPYFITLSFTAPHDPLQAGEEYENKCYHQNRKRRKFCAMMVEMDHHIGRLMGKVSKETIVVFFSDNGGNPFAGGYNYPFRGMKISSYEGGVKVPAFIHYGRINENSVNKYDGLTHVVDIYPTLLSMVGKSVISMQENSPISGISIDFNKKQHRNHTFIWLDNFSNTSSNIMIINNHQYKLIVGMSTMNNIIIERNVTIGGMDSNPIIFIGGVVIDLLDMIQQTIGEELHFVFNYLGMFLTMVMSDYWYQDNLNLMYRLQNRKSWKELHTFDKTNYFELYDLTIDPTESNDISILNPEIIDTMLENMNNNIQNLLDDNKRYLYCGDEQVKEMEFGKFYDDVKLEDFTRQGGFFVNIWDYGIIGLICVWNSLIFVSFFYIFKNDKYIE